MIKRFDLVKLRTTENVHWMSGPAGRPASTQSIWSVVAGVEGDKLMLSSDQTLIIIPVVDVIKVGDYDLEHTLSYLKSRCILRRKPEETKKHVEEGREG